MVSVLHNLSLFESLISCLKSKHSDVFDSSSSSAAATSLPQMNSYYTPGSRKRGLSFDKTHSHSDVISNKSLKLVHGQSPLVGKRSLTYAKPKMNIRVLAATILYVAMEPLDHWPVSLVEAYAEDCFGSRSWVEDPACQLLVENLILVHSDDSNRRIHEEDDEKYKQLVADSSKVERFYRIRNERRIIKNEQSQPILNLSSVLSSPRLSPTSLNVKSRFGRQRGNLLKNSDAIPLAPITSKKKGISSELSELKKITQSVAINTNKDGGDDESADSDSGDEEEEIAISTSLSKPLDDGSDGSSSSSGEEEEVGIIHQESFDENIAASNFAPSLLEDSINTSDPPPPDLMLTYPLQHQRMIFSKVRQRYFGLNLQSSHDAISEKLNERLDIKAKHNSGLLNCLPLFTSIPSVRTIITANLEKWLQSPALSGLARTLFSTTVNNMKNIDPPLRADLDALDNILRMRLKANQLNAHVENITAVANKIPTVAATKRIYGHILQEILTSMDSHDSSFSNHMSMIHAVHDVLPDQLCASGIASSILDLLINPPISLVDLSKPKLVRRIRNLIQTIAKRFGSSFDAYEVLNAMISYQVDPKFLWTLRDEENKARLMFQCVTLLVDSSVVTQQIQPGGKSIKSINPTEKGVKIVRNKLIKARKLIIKWCCEDYAPLCSTQINKFRKNIPTNGSPEKKKDGIVGAGPADYSSILDGLSERNFSDWINIIRCMLFLEAPESSTLRHFLSMDDTSVEDYPGWGEEAKRISFCCDFGADVDDAMVWVVLETATQDKIKAKNDVALLVLEHIFEGCKIDKKPTLLIRDAKLLYKLYELVEYIPPAIRNDRPVCHDCNELSAGQSNSSNISSFSIPRLGHPGMWWRVTGIALIMCGASPDAIGSVALEKFPTLKALIKMITSDRYRFPTVDSDDAAREEQKKTEQTMRDEEAKIAELLFAPVQKPKKKKHAINLVSQHAGSRSSKRQEEKRKQQQKMQREKEEAEVRLEASRRKKLLRAAQKSIMIWDPHRGPRKPPKESADLIFSLGELFDLPRLFRQKSTEPDFLLVTIGSTTRGAIERAYDWLIPIISLLPEAITRLPASASCFLLLRAYDTDGEERSQLQKLSSPLLEHVRDSLMGKFGEADAIRAFDLLLTDVASHNSDRRRCARRVLQNAIGNEYIEDTEEAFAGSNHAWAINIMLVEHVNSILGEVVKKLAVAASFERGNNLRFLVLALHKLTTFAKENRLPGEWHFASILIELVSRRPTIFVTTLSSFRDLCSLAIHVVFEEFKLYCERPGENRRIGEDFVDISLCCSPFSNKQKVATRVEMPLSLLQSSCVILSVWAEYDKNEIDKTSIDGLTQMLIKPRESELGNNGGHMVVDSGNGNGLAGAKLLHTQKNAIPVESWVMLAKSRSDFIAKRAALTAPAFFLPRLLLCSGLPRASLLNMIDRLGKLGENTADIDKTFNQLLVPSALSEWDIGRLGHRREISRKLFGRLSAYSRMYNLIALDSGDQVSFKFVEWLSETCISLRKSTKTKSKKSKLVPTAIFSSVESAKSLFNALPTNITDNMNETAVTQMDADASDMTDFLQFKEKDAISPPCKLDMASTVDNFLTQIFEENNPVLLDEWLESNFSQKPMRTNRKRKRKKEEYSPKISNAELSFLLLQQYILLDQKVEGLASALVKWIPNLSASNGSPKFWKALFADGQKPFFLWENLLSRCFQTWDHRHMARCRMWLLTEGGKKKLDLPKVVRFLVVASSFSTIHIESFGNLPVATEDSAWARTEDDVRSVTKFALDCLLASDYGQRLRSRSDPPECLVLLLLIARFGRNQVQFISGAIMKRIKNDDMETKCWLLLSLLRIYAYYPFSINLGDPILRSNLKEAVVMSADDWKLWRSPLDDSIEDLFDSVFSTISSARSIQSLVDISKKHPLLLLRKLNNMNIALEKDSTVVDNKIAFYDKAGTITGENLGGSLQANVEGQIIKLKVMHWGLRYTEYFWSAILDIISSVPNEVLFECAPYMGLLDVLDTYLRLIFVQSHLRTDTGRLRKLKEKLSEFLAEFKLANPIAYDSWMARTNCGLPSLGATRNVLVVCNFMTAKDAIAHIRKG